MFDSISIRCPHCNKKHVEQTKAGPCKGFEMSLEEASPILKACVSDEIISCEHCHKDFIVKTQAISQVYKASSEDRKYTEDDDWD